GDELALADADLAGAVARYEATFGDDVGLRGAEEAYAVARGQVGPLVSALERDRSSLARLDDRLAAVEQRRAALDAEEAELGRELESLDAEVARSGPGTEAALAAAGAAAAELGAAESAYREAEGLRNRLEARAEALGRAAAEAAGAASAAELAGATGVVGTLADLVDVDDGWHAAFEAAVGAAVHAVVVEGHDAARTALARLRGRDLLGTVLALGTSGRGSDHGGDLTAAPTGSEPIRYHVRPRVPAVSDALDGLLAGTVAVSGDWRVAVDLVLERPDLVVVTTAGDRFSRTGWMVRAGGALTTAAAAEEARGQAEAAAEAALAAAAAFTVARTLADDMDSAAVEAARRAERAAERSLAVRAARARVEVERGILHDEWSEAKRHRATMAERLEHDTAHLADLEGRLGELEAVAAAADRRLVEAAAARSTLEQRRAALVAKRQELEVRAAALAERHAVLANRLTEVERRLAGHVAERQQAGARRRRIEADASAVDRLHGVVEGAAQRLAGVLERLQELRARQIDEVRAGGARLEALRRQRVEAESRIGDTRQRRQRLELELAESGVRQEAAVEALRRELGSDPAAAIGAPCPDLPEGIDAATRAAALQTELGQLGPVNPLALEELGTLEERHRFLEAQVDDVRRARRELQQLIREVDDEIMRVFTDAFADVNAHFQVLVGTLFPGGTGHLTLSDPTDLLDTGVEVEARPAGKNVRKLSLLSGGERSLVALAFLFAVFRSRPSPFYLLDEVEAALDDVNLHRFLDLLHEFREEAQLIIVSHQKRTMEAADALYGVTMTPGGSSKVVSQKVRRSSGDEAPAAAAG
ncbi:MAG: AAA family ATPase, partial [Acidimicrobiales bacterium]